MPLPPMSRDAAAADQAADEAAADQTAADQAALTLLPTRPLPIRPPRAPRVPSSKLFSTTSYPEARVQGAGLFAS